MSTLTALILGVLIGWVVEWVIDWVYWRRRGVNDAGKCRDQLVFAEAGLASAEAELAASKKELQLLQKKVKQLEEDKAILGARLPDGDLPGASLPGAALPGAPVPVVAPLPGAPIPVVVPGSSGSFLPEKRAPEVEHADSDEPQDSEQEQRDDLEVIVGIGPVIAGRLNENGIYTFEQLAAQTPVQLRAMLGNLIQRLADEESWIEQARQLAQQKQVRGAGGQ